MNLLLVSSAGSAPPRLIAPVAQIVLDETVPFLEQWEWNKLRIVVAESEVEAVNLPITHGRTQVIDVYDNLLRVDLSHFAQAVSDGYSALVLAQAYFFSAELDYAQISKRTDEHNVSLPRRLRSAGLRYAKIARGGEVQTPQNQEDNRELLAVKNDEIRRVLAAAEKVLAQRSPNPVSSAARPDYEGLIKGEVAPYEAAAQVVRAKGEIKRARGEASCICHGTCLFYKGVATETAREYDFAVDAEDYTRAGCMAKMRRDCRGHGGVGQGVWGFNVVETDFTPGCR